MGRVLSDEDIEMLQGTEIDGLCWEWPIQREDFIATIIELRDRLNLASGGFDNMVVTLQYADEENVILREALEFYAKEDNWIGDGNIRHFDRPYGVAREALTKVRGDE